MFACGLLAAAVCSGTLTACATTASTTTAAQADHRRLLGLERAFFAFANTRLRSLDDVEAATAVLEDLRLDYVDVLAGPQAAERDRLLALLRLAELHLDLAARVRRVPYVDGDDDDAKRRFDTTLSGLALPLEATGLGMLDQLVARAARGGVEGRFVARARLYQRLHAHSAAALDDGDRAALTGELVAQTFRAPRSLLEAGRLSQRAARR